MGEMTTYTIYYRNDEGTEESYRIKAHHADDAKRRFRELYPYVTIVRIKK